MRTSVITIPVRNKTLQEIFDSVDSQINVIIADVNPYKWDIRVRKNGVLKNEALLASLELSNKNPEHFKDSHATYLFYAIDEEEGLTYNANCYVPFPDPDDDD